MKTKNLILLLLVLAIIALVIFFAVRRQPNAQGVQRISCGDTLEISYGANTNLMVKALQNCRGGIYIEQFINNRWDSLSAWQEIEEVIAVRKLRLDSGHIVFLTVPQNGKFRIICPLTDKGASCAVDITVFNPSQAKTKIKDTAEVPCGVNRNSAQASAKIYNFSRLPIPFKVIWPEVCTEASSPHREMEPKALLRKMDDGVVYSEPVAARPNDKSPFQVTTTLPAGHCIYIECPGGRGLRCRYIVKLDM